MILIIIFFQLEETSSEQSNNHKEDTKENENSSGSLAGFDRVGWWEAKLSDWHGIIEIPNWRHRSVNRGARPMLPQIVVELDDGGARVDHCDVDCARRRGLPDETTLPLRRHHVRAVEVGAVVRTRSPCPLVVLRCVDEGSDGLAEGEKTDLEVAETALGD